MEQMNLTKDRMELIDLLKKVLSYLEEKEGEGEALPMRPEARLDADTAGAYAAAMAGRAPVHQPSAANRMPVQGGAPAKDTPQALLQSWLAFKQMHPNADAKNPALLQRIPQGMPPQAADARMEMERLRAENELLRNQLRAYEKNWNNRRQTTGSMRSESVQNDPFLEGIYHG